MRRKFAVLTSLAALAALALPASSMATTITPAGATFEITGGATQPKVSSSLGSCSISKIVGTSNGGSAFSIPAPVVGSCTSGASLSLTGGWTFGAAGYIVSLGASSPGQVTMHFTSLPGCKLSNAIGTSLFGVWDNGTTSPAMKSGYHADGTLKLTWANDGGSCALAGTTEIVAYEQRIPNENTSLPIVSSVLNKTNSSVPIIIAG